MDSKDHPHRKALLVIDVQKGLFDRPTPIYQADLMLANIKTLIQGARRAQVPVLFIQHSNETPLKYGSASWQLHPAIQPLPGEAIIHKLEGNAFLGTNLGPELEKRQITSLTVCGLVTHGCVKATTLGALEAGYQVLLVSDAHSNFSKDAPKLVKKWNQILSQKGARLAETRDVTFSGI